MKLWAYADVSFRVFYNIHKATKMHILFLIFSALELYKEFAEEAYSIALHPSGLYVLVGFSDKLRLMNLLIDDIRIFKEFTLRNCKEV